MVCYAFQNSPSARGHSKLKLRAKFTASFILTAIVLCAVSVQVANHVVGRSYETMETRQATANFQAVERALRSHVETTINIQSQFANWSYSHAFTEGESDFPISESVMLASLTKADVDMMGFFHADGSQHGVFRNSDQQILTHLDQAIDTTEPGWSGFLDRLAPGYTAKGFLNTSSGSFFVSVLPIVKTGGAGDYAGHIVFGRQVDQDLVWGIKQQTNLNWSLKTEGAPGFVPLNFVTQRSVRVTRQSGDIVKDIDAVPALSGPALSVENDMTTARKTFESDDGQTRVHLSVDTPRIITLHGKTSIRTLMLILAGSMIVALFVLQALMEGVLIGPITALTKTISGQNAPKRRSVMRLKQRADEIGELYRTYDSLSRANEEHMEALTDAVAKAKAASVSKSEFLANMSHEIRTPMNGVLGMAQVMRSTPLSDVQTHYVDLMYDSGMALMTIINDILDFSKIESGKMELDPQPFDLKVALDSVLSLLRTQAREKEIDLIADLDDIRGRIIVGDVGRIRQIVTNLLGNAIKFTSEGHVCVRAAIHDIDARMSTVRIEVEDTGIGIPADKVDLIFDKFTQAEGSTTRIFGGTGLGLSISSRIVELMGGQIGVESDFGHGSTFWFEMTLETQSAAALPAPRLPSPATSMPLFSSASTPSGGTLSNFPPAQAASSTDLVAPGAPAAQMCDLAGMVVLIVDESDANRHRLTEQLTQWGGKAYSVDSAATGLVVLKTIAARGANARPVVISNRQMPDMDGLEFVTQIRADAAIADTPVIVLSSDSDMRASQALQDVGVTAMLGDPPSTSALIAALRTLSTTDDKAKPFVAPQTSAAVPPPAPKILVAEDNPVNRDVLRLMFEGEPYDLHFVHDGQEAVDAMRVAAFDLVLMDISMPVMDGVEATRAVRSLEAQTGATRTPIIAVTAHAMNTERDRYLAAGMDDHLPKPIIKGQLLTRIEDWLAAPKQTSAAVQNAA